MNRRLVNVLLIAFVIAAVCSYLAYKVVGKRVSGPQVSTSKVVAAATDIQLGTVLKATDLTTVEFAGTPPKGIIAKPEEAIGRGVVSNLYAGEPILESRLAAPGSGGGLAATIPPGMRASAVKVNDVVGVAGFATPGMRVDVLISGNPPGDSRSADGPRVKTLLQNIEVLSAGTDIQRDAEGKPKQVQVVNLLVDPEQAELLSLASSETHIQLVLRNPLDTTHTEPPGTAVAELFGAQHKVVVATGMHHQMVRLAPASQLVEVFTGSKRTETKFANEEER